MEAITSEVLTLCLVQKMILAYYAIVYFFQYLSLIPFPAIIRSILFLAFHITRKVICQTNMDFLGDTAYSSLIDRFSVAKNLNFHSINIQTILDKIHVDTARALVTFVTNLTRKREKASPFPQPMLVNLNKPDVQSLLQH